MADVNPPVSPLIAIYYTPPQPIVALPIPQPDAVDTVFYHKGCVDGNTSAWAAWKRLGDKAQYIPLAYSEDVPDVTGKHVALVDFSVQRPEFERFLASARSLILLDHHKTAEENLAGMPNTVFDQQRSGAMLAWEFFHPGVTVPDLVRYVQDQDLWRWALERSRDYFAGVELVPFKFDAYEELSNRSVADVVRDGVVVNKYIKKLVDRQARQIFIREWEGMRVALVNATAVPNELADSLLEQGKCDVAMAWYVQKNPDDPARGRFKVSLRSLRGKGNDVTKLAGKFGGGGHASASGFVYDGNSIEEVFQR